MSEIETLDLLLKQTNSIHEKKLNYQRFMNKYKSMTWNEINKDIINNHPTKYFEKVQQLKEPFKVKLELMGKFFQQQLELLQAQQYLSTIKVEIGSPLHIGTAILDNNITGNESTNSSVPSFEVTRSGRITKRPTYYQEDVTDKLDDLKIKIAKTPVTKHDKKENSDKISESNKVKENTSKAVRSVLSKYEQSRNAVFDALLADDNQLNVNNNEDEIEKFDSNESNPKTYIKRKHEDTLEIANKSDLDDFHSKTPKKYKGSRIFKSKNASSPHLDVINCDTSDCEDTNVVVDMPINKSPISSNQSLKTNELDDTIKKGRVSPPVISRKRNRKKNPIVKPKSQFVCPICNQIFSKKDIGGHASNCNKFCLNSDDI